MRIFTLIIAAILCSQGVNAFGRNGIDAYSKSDSESVAGFAADDCYILVDPDDSPVVMKAALMFAADLERVTGKRPAVETRVRRGRPAVIIGVKGHSGMIDSLSAKGIIDTDSLDGAVERYRIKTVSKPLKGIPEALVVAGSDRRGAAYGALAVSEAMGVSPWEWWADVPVGRVSDLRIEADYLSREPSVRYRGIFINDEDWGLKPWSSNNYEKELGDIGPRTYARVCELLLRLKGNMLAPAMHSCTGAFYSHAGSKEVADSFGIIITTSHCEPMLFNNAAQSEWDSERDGEWNYITNRATIYDKFDRRLKEAGRYENIYTIAMRGVHDEGMRGDLSMDKRVEVLTQVIADQREILEKHTGKAADRVPQIFVPYKETLDVYEAGLQLPDDVTIVWPDDNYGFMKHLSDGREQERRGGAGVYYHTSYLGTPHDYLWLCTTPPVLMYEELKKAYDYGADRYWLLNVGDIKPMELAIQSFMEMAWDMEAWSYEKAYTHQVDMLAGIIGAEYRATLQEMLDDYYRLAWSRKPEYMGWEREWDAPRYAETGPTDYSFDNYNDARGRLSDYGRLSDEAERIMSGLPDSLSVPFFEMLGYPVQASCQMNRKYLLAQLNGELLARGDSAGANRAAMMALAAHDSIDALCRRYNMALDGKWDGMMAVPEGFVAKYQNKPAVCFVDGVEAGEIDIEPVEEQYRHEGCHVVDLAVPLSKDGRSIRIIKGLGYDMQSVQLGEARPGADVAGECVTYSLPSMSRDSVEVTVYAFPFFPLNAMAGTQFGVSVDGGDMQTAEYRPIEWSHEWKTNVLRNSTENKFTFPIDPQRESHTVTLHAIDAGQIIQRIVVDYGGLKPSYVGPSLSRPDGR